MFLRTLLFSATMGIATATAALADLTLVMVEEAGCMWCAKWNDEISEKYPKTPEGQAAPLRRHNIRADTPDDLSFDRRLMFTPTFVLMRDGQEMSRIEGYPGEDFFWALLGNMIDQAGQNGVN